MLTLNCIVANFYVSNASWPLIICEPGLDDSSELWEPRSSGYLRQVWSTQCTCIKYHNVFRSCSLWRKIWDSLVGHWLACKLRQKFVVLCKITQHLWAWGIWTCPRYCKCNELCFRVRYSSNVTNVTLSTPVFYSGYSLISLRQVEPDFLNMQRSYFVKPNTF